MPSSLFQQIFGCCLGRSSSDPARRRLLPDDIDPEDLPPRDMPIPRIIPSEAETLAELIRETESKMVNVQDPHPFSLVPKVQRSSITPSHSRSRTSSPGGSHSLTPDADNSERSTSQAPGFPHREPILDAKLIRTYKGKPRGLLGKGRGRDRTRARDGSPIVGNGNLIEIEDKPKLSTLGRIDDDMLLDLSQNVRKSLLDGFRLHDAGKVVQTWDDT